jgi:alpha-D-ribose 1-methylphosphonate 5-triphosphate synthase subunit PhnI
MYVAVKGGEQAIDQAHALLAEKRRGDKALAALSVEQIRQQLSFAVSRVMSEGSLYDEQLAALAIKQAAGDLTEAIFLLRAYRTTLPRFLNSLSVDTSRMRVQRRISAVFKDVPGGQRLGATFDYTHRLLDFSLLDEEAGLSTQFTSQQNGSASRDPQSTTPEVLDEDCPRVTSHLVREGLVKAETDVHAPATDITREPLDFPTDRSQRLQSLSRGDEGFLLALAYSTQRGYGRNHPFAGEIRIGDVEVWIDPPELGFQISIASIELSECDMINQFVGSKNEPAQFTRGYGLSFGNSERKAMAMALVDRALRAEEYDEDITSPAQQDEFVLMHCDNVESSGFVSHLKLPHYVDFQSELDLIRTMRSDAMQPELETQP